MVLAAYLVIVYTYLLPPDRNFTNVPIFGSSTYIALLESLEWKYRIRPEQLYCEKNN